MPSSRAVSFASTLGALFLIALFGALVMMAERRAPTGHVTAWATITLPADGDNVELSAWKLGIGEDRTPSLRLLHRQGMAMFELVDGIQPRLHGSADRRTWFRLDRLPLAAGTLVRGAGFTLSVVQAGSGELRLRDPDSGRTLLLHADGAAQAPGTRTLAHCRPDPDWLDRVVEGARDIVRGWLDGDNQRLLSIGGNIGCPRRWPLVGLAVGGLHIQHDVDGFWLSRGGYEGPLVVEGAAPAPRRLPDWLSLDGVTLRMAVSADGRRVHASVQRGRQVRPAPAASDRPAVNLVTYGSASLLNWPGTMAAVQRGLQAPLPMAGLAMTVLTALGLCLLGCRRFPGVPVGLWHRCLLLLTLLLVQGAAWWLARESMTDDALSDAAFAGGIAITATLMLAMAGYLRGWGGPFWCLTLAIAGHGLLVHAQLAVGDEVDLRLGALRDHCRHLALAGLVVALAALPPPAVPRHLVRLLVRGPMERGSVGPMPVLIALVLLLVAWQLVAGGEQGVGGFLPVELAKTKVILLVAYMCAWYAVVIDDGGRARRWGLFGFGPLQIWTSCYLVPLLLVCGMLVALRDMSPILTLVAIMLAGPPLLLAQLAWRQAIGDGGWRDRLPLALLAGGMLLLVGGAMWIAARHAPAPSSPLLNQGGTLASRLAVWLDPDAHSVSGEQFLRARALVRAAPAWLPDPADWFGRAGAERHVPAIDSDMVAALVVGRFGMVVGVLLAMQQALWLGLLAGAGGSLLLRDHAAADPDADAARLFTGFAAILAAIAMGMQWLWGWSNPLGILPVVGQSMTWIARGGSHLLLFALPMLLIGLVAMGEEE